MTRRIIRTGYAVSAALFCGLAGPAAAQVYYNAQDARYVTTSNSPQVINYVVCLANSVDGSPEAMQMQDALANASLDCLKLAESIPDGMGNPTADDIMISILECGFRPGDASPDMGCGQNAATVNPQPTRQTAGIQNNGLNIPAGSWGGKVRGGPGMNYGQIASLNEGDPVVLLQDTGVMMNGYPWFEISFGRGQRGYQWGGILCAIGNPVYGVFETCTRPIAAAAPQNEPNGNIYSGEIGTYSRFPVQNDWHTGNIERDGNGLRWTNFAGVSWSLTPSGKFRLTTGRENPYFVDGRTAFDLIVSNGVVTGFLFGDEVYTKVDTVLPMNSGAMDPIAPQHSAGNMDGGRNVAVRETIRFRPGQSNTTLNNFLNPGEVAVFSIDAYPGQVMTIVATSPNNHAGFVIYDGQLDGPQLAGASEYDNAHHWTGRLTGTGHYELMVTSDGGGSDFQLFIEIR